jgi:oligopeptidase B
MLYSKLKQFSERKTMDLKNTPLNSQDLTHQPPRAEKRTHLMTYHGITLQDPYHWLRDKDWKDPQDGVKDPNILKYIKAENTYTEAFFDPLKPEIDRLFTQWKGYIPEIDESLKLKKGAYSYYYRQANKDPYPTYLRIKDIPNAVEEVYLDLNREAQGHKFYHLGGKSVSDNHQYMAYSVDTSGNEFHTLHVRDLITGEQLPDTIEKVSGPVIWDPDNSGFYYLKHTDDWHTLFLYHHRLGNPDEEDALLFEETDKTRGLDMSQSSDRKYLILETSTKEDDEVHVLDLTSPNKRLSLVVPRQKDRTVDLSHHEGYFYMLLNDMGSNRRLVRVPVEQSTRTFEEILPHDPTTYLTGFTPFKTHFVITLRKDGLDHIAIMDPSSHQMRFVSMEDSSYDLTVICNQYEDDHFWYEFSSLVRPRTTYKVTLNDLKQDVVKVQDIPSGFDPSHYQVERLWATARDGVKVPISVAFRKDQFIPGANNPCLLYGYGSYGYAIDAAFSNRALSYMNNGFVFAIAHIRGGDDLGYQWYLDGKYLKKKNTFHDFIDCAQALCDKGYTQPGYVAGFGGSAGGMLMGYVANNAPELFKGIAAIVPFVDVLNTMMDKSLPLTEGEFLEWGNPIDGKEYFEYILSYSPYENVKEQSYPALLITGGLTDPRVTYWEPTKWVAKLRDLHTGSSPILLKMLMDAGHGGGSTRDEKIREEVEILAFFKKIYALL